MSATWASDIGRSECRAERGFTLIELIVAVMILTLVVVGLTGAGMLASTQLRISQSDTRVFKAAQQQMELLIAQGYDSVSDGSATVMGYGIAWTVEGTTPKKVIMVIEREGINRSAVPDTFVTYVADWGS